MIIQIKVGLPDILCSDTIVYFKDTLYNLVHIKLTQCLHKLTKIPSLQWPIALNYLINGSEPTQNDGLTTGVIFQ
jgi:hypothetical protein